jgi:uncharacterized protein
MAKDRTAMTRAPAPLEAWFSAIASATVIGWLVVSVPLRAALPTSHGYVNDFAGVLDEATEADLATVLREVEAQTAVEIAVATVSSLEERPIEDYAGQLFQEWGIGQQGAHRGLLVLVFPKGRWTRIHAGHGLEGILPQALAGEIIRGYFEPKFSAEDYAGGIRDGVNRLVEIVRTHHVLTPEEVSRLNGTFHPPEDWLPVPFFALFLALPAMALGVGLRVQHIGLIVLGLIIGGVLGAFAWDTIPVYSQTILAPLTAVVVVMGFTLGARRSWRRFVRGGARSRGWIVDAPGGDSGGPSGWGPDGSSSSSSSSSDSSGGGSSGGGGGGASW